MDDGLTQQEGLYDPRRDERDACGVGFVAHVRGTASHEIVRQGLTLLENLSHRGAVGLRPVHAATAPASLVQLPHEFFRREAGAARRRAAAARRLRRRHALPPDRRRRAPRVRARPREHRRGGGAARPRLARRAREPRRRSGPVARAAAPVFRQVFIARGRSTDEEVVRAQAVRHPPADRRTRSARAAASTSSASRRARSCTRGCSCPSSSRPSTPTSARPDFTSAHRAGALALLHEHAARPGRARIRTASSATTARSTRCAAT